MRCMLILLHLVLFSFLVAVVLPVLGFQQYSSYGRERKRATLLHFPFSESGIVTVLLIVITLSRFLYEYRVPVVSVVGSR